MLEPSEHIQDEPAPITVESRNGLYVGQFIEDSMPYAAGPIGPPEQYDNDAERARLLQVVVDELEPVVQEELPYSSCTDGRIPLRLESGEPVPVREQLVGADILTTLFMADALGPRFFPDPRAPVRSRIAQVAEFLRSPSTHVPCGAGEAYPAISAFAVQLAHDPAFVNRNRLFVPVFDRQLFYATMGELAGRQSRGGLYAGYAPQLVSDAVRRASGPRGIAYLRTDDRGVHGHVEEFIVRVEPEAVAINEAGVAAASGDDREVFGQNDSRLAHLAEAIAHTDQDYAMAWMAGEAWTDAGHAALSRGLRTAVVRTRR